MTEVKFGPCAIFGAPMAPVTLSKFKLEIKDTVNNTPSNLNRVGEPRFYNIGGTTLRLSPVVVASSARHRHGFRHAVRHGTDTTGASTVRHRTTYDTASADRTTRVSTVRHHTTSTTVLAVTATPHRPYDTASTAPHRPTNRP
jgi:hypothetical protein